MKIKVGFSTTELWFSRLIRHWTKSQISHTYVKIKLPPVGELVFHADWAGVEIKHGVLFDKSNEVISEFEIEHDGLYHSIESNMRMIGKKYNYWDILQFAAALSTLRRWFKRKVKNPRQDPRKMICVDLVLHLLNDAGITNLPLGLMSPKDLFEWMCQNAEQLGFNKVQSASIKEKANAV